MKKGKKVAISLLFFGALIFGGSAVSAENPDYIHGCGFAGPCLWR